MCEAEEVKLHIKAVLNKEKTKLLFVEAGSDFTEVLLSFLALPVGTIVEVLDKHYGDKAPVVGSLNTLYKGMINLDIIYFIGESQKKELISPTLFESALSRLRLNVRGTQPTSSSLVKSYEGVFTRGGASFIISDDLRVLPIVAGSIIQTLGTLGIALEDMDGMETINVTFGMNEIVALLKESLISSNPLTALIFPRRQMTVATEEEHVWLHKIDNERANLKEPKNTILKFVLQKSTNKLLFAQADCYFVDFLFSMLRSSVGAVEWFLGSDIGFNNMDNLHRSVTSNFDTAELLIKDRCSICKYCREVGYNLLKRCGCNCSLRHASFYMVRDDLTVSPLGVTPGLSVINELKIPLSDIKEVELQVGLEERLSLLKAALTSTTALTDGLIKPFLKKQEMDIIKLESNS